MCGIAGAVSAAPIDERDVVRMRDELSYRGPDHAGLWRSEDGRVCLGHRRLAILDLSPEANQPFLSGSGRFALTFNGEIYNHAALRRELLAAGTRLRTHSDTEVLVEAYARWGDACLERLHGMFAFAIFDRVERQLFCARDRAGEKPFHYASVGTSFVFASELKSLLTWPGFRRTIDYTALADFLCFGCIPDPKTAWEGIRKLPPGHCLTVDLSRSSPRVGTPVPYWDLVFEPDRSVEDWGPQIRDALTAASTEMAFADVPVGTFLSGGLDSSAVVAALRREGQEVQSFTIGFADDRYDERPYAREVARSQGTDHTERVVEADDVAAVLEKLRWHYDEPFNDYSYVPTYYVCREARRRVTVALTGDGGDELFAGYGKYRRLALRSQLPSLAPALAGERFVSAATALLPERSQLRSALRVYGGDAGAMLGSMMFTGLSGRELRAVTRGPLRAALTHYAPEDHLRDLLRSAPPEEVGVVNAMRYLDFKVTLGAGILVKVDRASMAVSLETRPVFLHPTMLALAARIPPERLVRRTQTKLALRAALAPWLPATVLSRPKQGFAMPLGGWLRDELTAQSNSGGAGSRLGELIDPAEARRRARAHASGHSDHTAVLHSFGFLEQWLGRWS